MKSLGFSLQGKDHVGSGTPCQDYHVIFHLNASCVIAIIADGVGSAKLSDIGAKVATETVLAYLKNHLHDGDDNTIMEVLEDAYQKGLDQLQSLSKDFRTNIEDFDTTLTTAIIKPNKIFYGHSGDGGVILLLENGAYEKLTLPQKGQGGGTSVIPLRFSEQWEFGVTEESAVSVLLATDGIYDTFSPHLLKSESVPIYVHRLEQFMNISHTIEMEQHQQRCMAMTDTPSLRDDRTMVLIVHENKTAQRQNESYYAIPDWLSLQKKNLKALYPNLTDEEINAFISLRNEETTVRNNHSSTQENLENKEENTHSNELKPKDQ
jgi:serine/threonine protein phosphatase PrpC